MSTISVDINKLVASSQTFDGLAAKMKSISTGVSLVDLNGIMKNRFQQQFQQSIRQASEKMMAEAVGMRSLSSALLTIAEEYRNMEAEIIGAERTAIKENTDRSSAQQGSDKRNLLQKFWDWLTGKEPDKYDTTTLQQEKAADAAMKRQMRNVLQDEKYSQEYWDRATVEERKQILQDYMDAVIVIYGLKHVNSRIVWKNQNYTASSITWGNYSHAYHRVTLNEQALTDRYGNWDSYQLLETVGHELRHAYQHEAVDNPTGFLVSKETLSSWRDNIHNYISSDQDYDAYRAQPIEVDARNFQVTRNG